MQLPVSKGKRGSIWCFCYIDWVCYAILRDPIGLFRVRGVFLFYFVGIGVIGVIDVRTSIDAGCGVDGDITGSLWV